MAENKVVWEQGKAFIIRELQQKGYSRISMVGQGAFSMVLRVWDDKVGGFRACKVSTVSEMAQNEAEMLQGVQHPLFPKYEASWESRGYFFLLMEYVCGSNVRELSDRRGRFTQRQAVHIVLELAQGLLFLHERDMPILFRDVKPENVMLRQDGRVKLVDMGCAVLLSQKQRMAGSKGYSAPEQFGEQPDAGRESDVYALGMLLLFMLTGAEGCSVSSGQKYRYAVRRISPKLLRLIQQTIRQERHRRIPDMYVLIKHLVICERRVSVLRGWECIKSIFGRQEIVDFYYVQNIRRGIDI